MTKSNLYKDVKNGIDTNFSFLKEYNFSDFVEKQLAYEYHFECSNDKTKIDIWFELIPSTPIWIKISEYYIETLEPNNNFLKKYNTALKKLYTNYFDKYLETNQDCWFDKLNEQYKLLGRELNNTYFKEMAQILKRNENVLLGDIELLKANYVVLQTIDEQNNEQRRIKDKIYSCEFKIKGGIEAEYESNSLQEIRTYFKKLADNSITDIQVFDWNKQRIPFSLD